MSKDPASLMIMNPSAQNLSTKEKRELDKLFTLFKEGALAKNIGITKNCLEILSAPFGLLHPRREEAVEVLIRATKIPTRNKISRFHSLESL